MYVGEYANGKFHGKGTFIFTQEYTHGRTILDMKEISWKEQEKAMETGLQIILIQKVINMKVTISMTRKMDLANTFGKMEQHMKDIS